MKLINKDTYNQLLLICIWNNVVIGMEDGEMDLYLLCKQKYFNEGLAKEDPVRSRKNMINNEKYIELVKNHSSLINSLIPKISNPKNRFKIYNDILNIKDEINKT
jgi:hypothetical protein